TLPSINGNPANMSDPSSTKIADTESKALSNWVPQWCRKSYNDLFGDDGIITRIVAQLLQAFETRTNSVLLPSSRE
ncbi:hypothetical protein U1Q18_051866, partial [Sarracenia purpurea var. burkii]